MLRLKPLARQTVVITGASSGIGLATAIKAARAGANLMLVARNETRLASICEWIGRTGGTVDYHVADVSDEAAVQRACDATVERFDGFDTWINNAGVGFYSRLEDLETTEHQRIFETNYWGTVFGSLAALKHFRERGQPGALINVGSINSDMPSPILSAYAASKHAVKGFTDSLRLEAIHDKLPVSITLIKPAAIGTPFALHSGNHTQGRPRLPPPIYDPDLVADAILRAAVKPTRSTTVGGAGRAQALTARLTPHLFDKLAAKMPQILVDKSHPVPSGSGNLFAPSEEPLSARGDQCGRRFSLTQNRAGVSSALLIALGVWATARVLHHR